MPSGATDATMRRALSRWQRGPSGRIRSSSISRRRGLREPRTGSVWPSRWELLRLRVPGDDVASEVLGVRLELAARVLDHLVGIVDGVRVFEALAPDVAERVREPALDDVELPGMTHLL